MASLLTSSLGAQNGGRIVCGANRMSKAMRLNTWSTATQQNKYFEAGQSYFSAFPSFKSPLIIRFSPMDKVASQLTKVISRSTNISSKPITLEVANLAKLADGACTCSLGDTSVLVAAVSKETQKPAGSTFVPLSVDYRQKTAASGRIPTTHLRRDIGISEKEILTSRIIDRSLRPAFAKGFYYDTQIVCNLLAVDGINDPDVLAINGASASLSISDIPWNGPIGAARIGLVGENVFVNPSRHEQDNSRLNLVLAANGLGNLTMMEGFCREPVLIPDIQKAIKCGIKECRAIVQSILKLQKTHGKPKRVVDLSHLPNEEHKERALKIAQSKVELILADHTHDKISRDEALKEIRQVYTEEMKETFQEIESSTLSEAFSYVIRKAYQKILGETKIRCDGRQLDQLRPISCKVDLFKPLHGSAVFERGQTQVFCSTTFDSPDAAFRNDSMTSLIDGIKEKSFMLHYEFPKFATKDIGRGIKMPDRREIGHGALAERAIRPLVPSDHEMTIRLNCEVLESNGSSSMASVCAGSLSLMDAGVNIGEHVAGVAMGLFSDQDDPMAVDQSGNPSSDHIILTDILGFEDYLGDMDFKIAGTRNGITAFMLDVKLNNGVSPTTIYKAIKNAHDARGRIINLMCQTIQVPRKEKKSNHPVVKTIHVPPQKRAKFIGFGGANLKKLTADIGVRISSYGLSGLEEDVYDETVGSGIRDNFIIFAPNKEAMQEAEEFIAKLLEKEYREPELQYNAIYTATIQELRPNGVMITLYPRMTPALLHLSQLDIKPISHPSALNLDVGQQIQVKYLGRDPATGQMRLSRKILLMSSNSKIYRTPLS